MQLNTTNQQKTVHPSTESQNEISWFQKAMGVALDKFVQMNAGQRAPGGQKLDYIPKATDSANVEQIQMNLRGMAFRNDWTRVVLPGDWCGCPGSKGKNSVAQAQANREAQFRREASSDRFSHFMVTPTDGNRLNNPAQSSFVKQRQLTVPSTTSQFYAFMHGIAAAFGSIDQ